MGQMSILVTGCAGFIGSNVCRLLLERGDSVMGVDNMNDAYSPDLKRWRLERLKPHPSFVFQHMDISEDRKSVV